MTSFIVGMRASSAASSCSALVLASRNADGEVGVMKGSVRMSS
jgi:hypothetical protein